MIEIKNYRSCTKISHQVLYGNVSDERERKKGKRENFLTKSSNLRHNLAHSQNKGLSEYQRRAVDWPIPRQRQGGRLAPTRAGRKGANSAPETASPPKLRAGSQLLTKSSWDPGWLTSARRVTARDQLPRRDTQHT